MPAVDPVLILSGPPGAGKTTVARRLARRFERAAHVEADRFFGFIESGFIDPWRPESHEQNAAVMQIVANTAAAYADAGYLTIVEGIVIPRWFLGPLRETLGHAGHGVAYAVLSAPLELCVARRPLIDPGVVESLWSQFADLGEFESSRLDVTDAAPEAIAAQLADGLHGHLLLSP